MMAHLGTLIGSDDLISAVSSFSCGPTGLTGQQKTERVLPLPGRPRVFRLSGRAGGRDSARHLGQPRRTRRTPIWVPSRTRACRKQAVARLHAFVDREGPSVIT